MHLATTVTITCILGNVDSLYMETVAVSKGRSVLFNESGNSGMAMSGDGLITLAYLYTVVYLSISQIHCGDDGVYTVIVNNILKDSITLVVISK